MSADRRKFEVCIDRKKEEDGMSMLKPVSLVSGDDFRSGSTSDRPSERGKKQRASGRARANQRQTKVNESDDVLIAKSRNASVLESALTLRPAPFSFAQRKRERWLARAKLGEGSRSRVETQDRERERRRSSSELRDQMLASFLNGRLLLKARRRESSHFCFRQSRARESSSRKKRATRARE